MIAPELAANLKGRRVLVTRAEESASSWADEIAKLGARPVLRPSITTETLTESAPALRAALGRCSWLVLTSARAVDALREILVELPFTQPVASVGARTTARARAAGLRVALEAREGHVTGLAHDLAAALPSLPSGAALPCILHAGAEDTRGGLEDLETERRARVEHVAIYRTVPLAALPESEREMLDVDVVLFASPSAVTGFVGRARVPERTAFVTIGPSTTAAARDAGLRVAGEAVTRDLLGLLQAIPRENGR